MAFARGPKTVTDGLVLYLDAANPKSYPGSGTTWGDLSGNGNNGTLVNTPTFSLNNGGKFSFDGVDTSITTNYDFGWNDTNSVSVLVTLTPSILQNRGFIGKGLNNQWEWQLNQRNDKLELVYWNTGGSHSNGPITSIQSVFSINTTVSVGLVWNHIDGKHYFYKNGNLIGENTWVDASINQNRTNGLIIGGQIYAWNLGGNYWNGDIHNVHLYNRALTSQEILQNYNATKARYGL